MNDTELDRLLDSWEAPSPSPSVWRGLLSRFPRPEPRRRLPRRLGWFSAAAAASLTLALGLAQSDPKPLGAQFIFVFHHMYDQVTSVIDSWQAPDLVARIRQSEPRVYVDGQLAPPLEYGPAARIDVRVPGDGVYSFISFRGHLNGWIEAGRIHDNSIEFLPGQKLVRIECRSSIVDSDRPVFVRHRP